MVQFCGFLQAVAVPQWSMVRKPLQSVGVLPHQVTPGHHHAVEDNTDLRPGQLNHCGHPAAEQEKAPVTARQSVA